MVLLVAKEVEYRAYGAPGADQLHVNVGFDYNESEAGQHWSREVPVTEGSVPINLLADGLRQTAGPALTSAGLL
jgi:hypothetical protein